MEVTQMSKQNEEIMVPETETNELSLPMEDMGNYLEDLDGLGSFTFEKIKIPSGGGVAFEVPGDDPESPDIMKAIEGVVVLHQPKNVYFRGEYSGASEDGNRPDCSSADGKTGVMTDSGTTKSCATCSYNQFGSGRNGGKACQNRMDLYILMEGEMFPKVLSLPATSLKDFKTFLALRVVAKKQRLCQVKTKITLKKAKNKGGIEYSSCVFSKIGDVSPEEMHDILEMRELCRGFAQQTLPAAQEFQEIQGEDEGLPF
jgi:hypothetical protein